MNKIKKISIALILLISFIAIGFFVTSKKSFSFEFEDAVISKELSFDPIKLDNEMQDSAKILFLGDMMFDRYIRQVSEKRGYDFVFQKVGNLLRDNDLVIGNLEGPLTDSVPVSVSSKPGERNNFIFTFDSKVSDLLASQNIKLVNIGNNHILNFASSGVESTRKYLTQSGVDFFGDPEDENKRLVVRNIKGASIAFVNYNQFIFKGEQKAINDIVIAKGLKADFIILYAHWGKEYVLEPEEKIKALAHEFIDNGVDLIIGSHPHVVQPKEEYSGKMIYYSLGNFIFDQYFDPNTQQGLAVQIEIDPKSKKIYSKDFPLTMKNNGQTLQD